MSASGISSITLAVGDLEKFYPSSGPAFFDFTDSVSDEIGDPNNCAKSYSATVTTNSGGKSLTNF